MQVATAGRVIEAFLALLGVGASLKFAGLRRVVRLLEGIPARGCPLPDHSDVRQWGDIISVAADFVPYRARCLHRYLALCWVLRRRGIAAEVVVGVRKYPFIAHVWLECNGEIIHWRAGLPDCERLELLQTMSIVFRLGESRVGGRKAGRQI
jgi:hypothetical protein